jgi:hypothetical protein
MFRPPPSSLHPRVVLGRRRPRVVPMPRWTTAAVLALPPHHAGLPPPSSSRRPRAASGCRFLLAPVPALGRLVPSPCRPSRRCLAPSWGRRRGGGSCGRLGFGSGKTDWLVWGYGDWQGASTRGRFFAAPPVRSKWTCKWVVLWMQVGRALPYDHWTPRTWPHPSLIY